MPSQTTAFLLNSVPGGCGARSHSGSQSGWGSTTSLPSPHPCHVPCNSRTPHGQAVCSPMTTTITAASAGSTVGIWNNSRRPSILEATLAHATGLAMRRDPERCAWGLACQFLSFAIVSFHLRRLCEPLNDIPAVPRVRPRGHAHPSTGRHRPGHEGQTTSYQGVRVLSSARLQRARGDLRWRCNFWGLSAMTNSVPRAQ